MPLNPRVLPIAERLGSVFVPPMVSIATVTKGGQTGRHMDVLVKRALRESNIFAQRQKRLD